MNPHLTQLEMAADALRDLITDEAGTVRYLTKKLLHAPETASSVLSYVAKITECTKTMKTLARELARVEAEIAQAQAKTKEVH